MTANAATFQEIEEKTKQASIIVDDISKLADKLTDDMIQHAN